MADIVARLERCLANQETVLNLGNCGLCDDDFSYTGDLGRLLAQCTHVKTLILSNYYYDWILHESPVLGFNARYIYHQRDNSWEKGFKNPRWREPIDYFPIPTFRPLVAIGAGGKTDNHLGCIPAVVACLPNLEVLVCGGTRFKKWEIDSLAPLQGLDKLKTLILSNNSIKEADWLHWFPQLEKLDLSNNQIDHLYKVAGHSSLEYLDLSNNELPHAYEINKFPNLRWLSLANNRLETMDGVNNLPLLQVLDLSTNAISDFKPFEWNVLLEKLNFSNNLISQLDYLGEVPRLKCLFGRCNRIKQIRGINNLRQLQVLDLSHNMIAQLPASFKGLKALEILDLSNNYLQVLTNIFNLPKLRLINVSTNYINRMDCRADCPSLEELNLNNNRLSGLKMLPYFRNLRKLYARENDIEEVVCGNNTYLTEVILSSNKIRSLKFVRECVNLVYLEIDKNRISNLNEWGYHPNLCVLYAEGNCLSGELSVQHLPGLQLVDVSSNNIRQVSGITGLPHLKSINLEYNIIEDIGVWEELPALQSVNLRGNRIRDLVGRLGLLPALKMLEASRNQISAIPDLQLFPQLKRLILSTNKIHKLDKLVPHPSLKEIRLDQNNIVLIADTTFLFNFYKLDLSNNPLSRIIGFFNLLKKEKGIYIREIEGTGLEIKWFGKNLFLPSLPFNIPKEIGGGDSDNIKSWIIAMDEGGVVNTEVRVVLLGNGETGKTALSYYYRNGRFYKKNDRTHGIYINKWEVNLDNLPKGINDQLRSILQQNFKAGDAPEIKSIIINLWDFGGQEFYHATHRLFMSKDILYLVLWNKDTPALKEGKKKKKEEDLPIDYWIKNIQHYAPGSSILLVQNKADNEYAVDNDTSFKICRYNEASPNSVIQYILDMETLKEGILKKVATLPNFARYIPKVYDDIKFVIENSGRHFISFAEYEEICQETDYSVTKIMSDPHQRDTLLRYLDNIGTVVYFRYHEPMEDEFLKDYVFTNPKWLVTMIYEILGDDEQQYEFDSAHVEKIVAPYRLSADIWIKIMKNAGLIFEVISKSGPRYIIPQYLPEKCKDQTAYEFAMLFKHMPHSFTLRYPHFMSESNFLRLISHYGSEHVNHLYWRKGLVSFRNGKTVFIACNIEKRVIRVSVQDNDSSIVKDILERIQLIDPVEGLEVSIDEECFVILSTLKTKNMAGKLEIDATNGETLAIKDFNYLFKIQPFEKQRTVQIKKKIRIFVAYSGKDGLLQELLIEGLKDHLSARAGCEFEFWSDKAIDMGTDWKAITKEHILKADVALVLVSPGFVSSPYIQKEELGEFLMRMTNEGLLILPVLIRNYDFVSFEKLSGLQFFKAYYNEYGYNAPVYRTKFMPFDVLAENDNTANNVLNDYYKNLADMIFSAVSNHFSVR